MRESGVKGRGVATAALEEKDEIFNTTYLPTYHLRIGSFSVLVGIQVYAVCKTRWSLCPGTYNPLLAWVWLGRGVTMVLTAWRRTSFS